MEIRDREQGIEVSPRFAESPLRRVMETCKKIIVHLDDPSAPSWVHTDLFAKRCLVEYVFIPLCSIDGAVSVVSFCTCKASGFTQTELEVLDRIVPSLRNACELRTLRRTELTLLDTYNGATTARRILGGRIRRGQIESLEAALFLCDLRGFTELSNRLPGEQVIALLNAYFDSVVPSIAAAGGEVIKFMGDAARLHRRFPIRTISDRHSAQSDPFITHEASS